MSLQEFLAMGGYAAFVWPSYALALVVLVANAIVPHRRERRLLQRIARDVRRNGSTR